MKFQGYNYSVVVSTVHLRNNLIKDYSNVNTQKEQLTIFNQKQKINQRLFLKLIICIGPGRSYHYCKRPGMLRGDLYQSLHY